MNAPKLTPDDVVRIKKHINIYSTRLTEEIALVDALEAAWSENARLREALQIIANWDERLYPTETRAGIAQAALAPPKEE